MAYSTSRRGRSRYWTNDYETVRRNTSIVEVRSIEGLREASAAVSPLNDPEALFPASGEELMQTGLLVWRLKNPEDLAENEYATTEWRIGDEVFESGLSFEGVPRGQIVMVLLWTGEFLQYYANDKAGDPPDRMPFCICYPGTRKFPERRWGRMNVPQGWEGPYGNLGSGGYVDGGWLMLRSNREERKTGRFFAFLELVYRFKTEPGAVDNSKGP